MRACARACAFVCVFVRFVLRVHGHVTYMRVCVCSRLTSCWTELGYSEMPRPSTLKQSDAGQLPASVRGRGTS